MIYIWCTVIIKKGTIYPKYLNDGSADNLNSRQERPATDNRKWFVE